MFPRTLGGMLSSFRALAVCGLRRRQGDVYNNNPFSIFSKASTSFDPPATFDHIKYPPQLKMALMEKSRSGFKNLSDFVALYERMVEIGSYSTTTDFNYLFTIITESKSYPTAIILIKRMRHLGNIPIDDFTLNVMLNCYCRLDRVHYALAVFSTYFKLGYDPPHETAFTLVMNGLIREKRLYDALGLFDIFVRERGGDDTDLNCVTQATVLNALFKTGNEQKAIRMLDQIGQNCDDPLISDTVINGLCKSGHVDDAVMTYYSCIQPTIYTFTSLIQGFAKLGRWDDVKELLREMVVEEVLPNLYRLYVLTDSEWEVLDMVEEVLYDDRIYDWVSVEPCIVPGGSVLAEVYYSKGYPLEDILKVMEDAKVDLVAYNTVMKAYCADGRVEEALQIFSDGLASRGFFPNISSYNILIGAYCDRMELDLALRLYRERLPQEGLRPDTETLNCLLKGLLIGGRCDDARVIFHDMVANRGMVPDRLMYTNGGGKAEKKWLEPDFFHEEIFNRAEKLLLGRLMYNGGGKAEKKFLEPDFFHEETFNRAEKLLLRGINEDLDYSVSDLVVSKVLDYLAGRVTRHDMELLIDFASSLADPRMKQLVSALQRDLDAQGNQSDAVPKQLVSAKRFVSRKMLMEVLDQMFEDPY